MNRNKPTLSFAEIKQRQHRLLSQCKANSIVVIRSASELTRSRDTEFPFRQDSDFFYLTGFNEPDSWLILSNQTSDCLRAMAVRPSDPEKEIWHGRRLGLSGAEQAFELDACFSVEDIEDALVTLLDKHEHVYWSLGHHSECDSLLNNALSTLKASRTAQAPHTIIDWQPLVHQMRLIKSNEELQLMQYAADVSCAAHKRAMQFACSGCYEYQLAAEIHHEFAMNGAYAPAYNTIVGAGDNACILHYTENSDVISDGKLVLIDAGAEYQGYAADITRTFPVNGIFSTPQKALYQWVLDAQYHAIEHLVAGSSIVQVNNEVIEILTQGLVDLSILSGDVGSLIKDKAYRRFYMHGLGHWLGLDVHDVGKYKENGQDIALKAGMVLTVEPGLYIPNELDIPEAYRGIGIRIEDNILITDEGNKVLTANVPKTVEDIEALMAKPFNEA